MYKLYFFIYVFSSIIISQTQYRVNINNINLPIDNRGNLATVNIPPDGAGGIFANHVFLFSGGFYLGGYDNDTIWTNGVAAASLIEDYLPGTVNNEPSDPKNIIYILTKNDQPFGQSWQDWSNAVELGADFYDGDTDGNYIPIDLNGNNLWDNNEDKPALIGNLMTWCVFNDEVPANQRRYNSISPKGIEIQQSVLAFSSTQTPLSNTIFIRYRIINTGTVTSKLDSVIFSMYADADLGDYVDDLNGCDTILNSTFFYNDGADNQYGSTPPAFYTKFLQGPISYIPGETFIDNNSNNIFDFGIDTPLDTAYNRRGNDFSTQFFVGAKNLKITANNLMIGGDPSLSDPNSSNALWYYLNGKDNQGMLVDPCNFTYGSVNGGVDCSKVNPFLWFSGDPVSNIGWIDTVEADIRNMVSTGRFTLEENKPIDIWVAYIVDDGSNSLDAITVTRNHATNVQTFFEDNFTNGIVSVDNNELFLTDFKLSQNYPNPFNPATKISWQLPEASFVTLKIFNSLGEEVETLVNEFMSAGTHSKLYIVNSALPSGVYFYQLKAGDFIQTNKMVLIK